MKRGSWRYSLHGRYLTWCLNLSPGWVRIGRLILRWEWQ